MDTVQVMVVSRLQGCNTLGACGLRQNASPDPQPISNLSAPPPVVVKRAVRAANLATDSLTCRDYFDEYEGGDGCAALRTRPLADSWSFTTMKYAAVPQYYDVWWWDALLRRDQAALHVCNPFTCTCRHIYSAKNLTPTHLLDIFETVLPLKDHHAE